MTPPTDSEVEALAAEIHGIYCKQYEKNFGKPYKTNGDYYLLDEPTKDYDRAFVLWHLAKMRASQEQLRLADAVMLEIKGVILGDSGMNQILKAMEAYESTKDKV